MANGLVNIQCRPEVEQKSQLVDSSKLHRPENGREGDQEEEQQADA